VITREKPEFYNNINEIYEKNKKYTTIKTQWLMCSRHERHKYNSNSNTQSDPNGIRNGHWAICMYMHIIIFLAHAQVMNDRIAIETKRKRKSAICISLWHNFTHTGSATWNHRCSCDDVNYSNSQHLPNNQLVQKWRLHAYNNGINEHHNLNHTPINQAVAALPTPLR